MDWYVVRHPDTGGVAVVAESALPIHKGGGWIRVAGPVAEGDKLHLDLSTYADAPDLDPAPAAAAAKAAKPTSKES